jgi:hypothetical protein
MQSEEGEDYKGEVLQARLPGGKCRSFVALVPTHAIECYTEFVFHTFLA